MDAIAEHLEAVFNGQIRRLLINVPPGTAKPVSVDAIVYERDLGRIPLGDVAVGHLVLTHLGRFRRVEEVHEQGTIDTMSVFTLSSRQIICGYDHPFLTQRGWIPAYDLQPTDMLKIVSDELDCGYGDRVIKLEPAGKHECRCLTVDEDHSFTANDIAVKNSLMCGVFFPAWVWTRTPSIRFLTASYSKDISTRDAVRCRRLIESPWYQGLWGDKFQLLGDQNQKQRYENDKTGFRISTSVGGTVTGERGHIRILDDPHKVDEAISDKERGNTIEWMKSTWSTRESDPNKSAEVVIMQRLHEADVSGYLLELGTYEHLCLPMRFEPDKRCKTILFTDPRTKNGELLCPGRFDEEAVTNLEKRLMQHASGQLQQRPAPMEGELFKLWLWRFWYPSGITPPLPYRVRMKDGEYMACGQEELPEDFDRMGQSWDMAFKGTEESAYVVGQVWGVKEASGYLVDQIREHLDFPATCTALKTMSRKWPQAAAKWVEDAANGPAVIASLRKQISGLIPVKPEGTKEARANAISSFQVSGNIYLPHPTIYPWVEPLLNELTQFPNSRYKDQVDALSQAVNQMMLKRMSISKRLYTINQDTAVNPGLAAVIMQEEW